MTTFTPQGLRHDHSPDCSHALLGSVVFLPELCHDCCEEIVHGSTRVMKFSTDWEGMRQFHPECTGAVAIGT